MKQLNNNDIFWAFEGVHTLRVESPSGQPATLQFELSNGQFHDKTVYQETDVHTIHLNATQKYRCITVGDTKVFISTNGVKVEQQ